MKRTIIQLDGKNGFVETKSYRSENNFI